MDVAIELGDNYRQKDSSLEENVHSIIRWQNTKSATGGFLSELGGIVLLPLTLPANINSVILVQMRIIAAFVHSGGHDLKSDEIKTFVYTCLAGNGAKLILKN
ncbi:hypothetical protein [Pseudalkalibacillus hwajinpoensis]|uniref:hypothetical protein n=1 Tax=Guptibacillus hwajinpoensis TaxID=208199 RepID=UPI001CD549B3|nr:hypothetical protein [Pseudalkalibacillus hwajinpoensis]MCA0991910.1 hypothetical protein [Pseudalkalibacillus hwajinpoensis]